MKKVIKLLIRPPPFKYEYTSENVKINLLHKKTITMESLMDLLPTVITLFSGVGGTSLGLYMAQFREIMAIDNWHIAQRNFENNFKDGKYGYVPFWNADIMNLTGEEILRKALLKVGELSALVITSPCQGFSIASGKADPLDPRNGCFLKSIELAAAIKSKVIVWENVPGMFSPKMTPIMNEIKFRFKEQLSDYKIFCFRVNALWFGAPSDRERVIFIAIRLDIFKAPPVLRPLVSDISQFTIKNMTPNVEMIHFGQSKRVIRLPHEFCPTITATEGIYCFENEIWAPLATNESYLKRYSSFPDDFELLADETAANKCKLIGNAVPPMLMYAIASYIRTEILGYPPTLAIAA
jgi:site-specific DNA-cytosine methylase